MEGVVPPGPRSHRKENVEHSGVDRMDVAGTEIAQEVIDPGEGRWVIPASLVVHARERFARVGVYE